MTALRSRPLFHLLLIVINKKPAVREEKQAMEEGEEGEEGEEEEVCPQPEVKSDGTGALLIRLPDEIKPTVPILHHLH